MGEVINFRDKYLKISFWHFSLAVGIVVLWLFLGCAVPKYSESIPSFCLAEAAHCKYVHDFLGHETRIVKQEGTTHYYCEAKINGVWIVQGLAIEDGKIVVRNLETVRR